MGEVGEPARVRAGAADLRLGRWESVLSDVMCDALIVDAPYSARTHAGHDTLSDGEKRDGMERSALGYRAWGDDDVRAFVDSWSSRTRGWFVTITDHILAPVWADALEMNERYVFSPLAFVAPGSRVRIQGDGPSQWSCWIVAARPRGAPYSKWGTLPGAYVMPGGQDDRKGAQSGVTGGKPLWLMRSLVRDYSRPGDLVCDPCAGGGTTLLAAITENRRAVGAEVLEAHHAIAARRLARGFTPALDFGGA